MRILVTRPKAQADGLVNALRAEGHEPVILPLMEIVTYTDACRQLERLHQFRHVIAISTNAAAAVWAWIDKLSLTTPPSQQWYAIGSATHAVLAQHIAFVEQSGVAMNSESLLQHPALQQVQGEKILICRGRGGRDHLRCELESRGASVEYCELYAREAVIHPAGTLDGILQQGLDLITATSTETVQLLRDQAMMEGVASRLFRIPVVVPGSRVGAFARNSGFVCVAEADNAGLPSMLDTIRKTVATQHT